VIIVARWLTDELAAQHPRSTFWHPHGRYARAALAREAARVRAAAPGSCNDTLNRAAFSLGQLVAAGLLDPEQVRGVLLAAALQAPATRHADRERKAIATIASGLRGGAAKPRRRRDGAA
jgi:hypothetical protein